VTTQREFGLLCERLVARLQDSHAQLIAGMAKHPIAIERPIVVKGNRAALGRPPEAVLKIL